MALCSRNAESNLPQEQSSKRLDSMRRQCSEVLQSPVVCLQPRHYGKDPFFLLWAQQRPGDALTLDHRSCRVRVCIFATTSWKDTLDLINMITKVSCKLQIKGVTSTVFTPDILPKQHPDDPAIVEQSIKSDASLCSYVEGLSKKYPGGDLEGIAPLSLPQSQEAVEASVKAFYKYGLGPSSARWFYGTFDVFIALERRLANLYPSLEHHSGRCRGQLLHEAWL